VVADVLFDARALGGGRFYNPGAGVLAAAIAGAGMGLVARRVGGSHRRRVLVLALVSIPTLYVVAVIALTLIFARELAAAGSWWSAASAPLGALLYGLVGVVFLAPVGVLPALAAAVTIERLVPSKSPKGPHRVSLRAATARQLRSSRSDTGRRRTTPSLRMDRGWRRPRVRRRSGRCGYCATAFPRPKRSSSAALNDPREGRPRFPTLSP
jgi:hypothetical protein